MNLVSIIIPLRAGDEVLPCCFDSIRAQELRGRVEYEVIVEESAGNACVNRNAGAAKARGDILLFCDADIELAPAFLVSMVDALTMNPDAAYAYCRYDRKGALTGLEGGGGFDREELMRRNYISTMSPIRTERFLGFNEKLRRLQDWELWLRMLSVGWYGVFVDFIGFTAHYELGDVSAPKVKTAQEYLDEWNSAVKAVWEDLPDPATWVLP